MAARFNHEDAREATRCISDDPALAYACYEGAYDPEQGEWAGTHVGAAGTLEEAEAWLEGKPAKLVRIWSDEQIEKWESAR